MLITLTILLLILIFGIAYLGVSLTKSIKMADNKMLFWILYVVTILSIFQLIVCILLFAKYRKKQGPIGPRGYMGERGEEGEPGDCQQTANNDCRRKTLLLLIIKRLEEHLGRKLYDTEITDLHGKVYFIGSDGSGGSEYNLNLSETTYEDLKEFDNKLKVKINTVDTSDISSLFATTPTTPTNLDELLA